MSEKWSCVHYCYSKVHYVISDLTSVGTISLSPYEILDFKSFKILALTVNPFSRYLTSISHARA